MTTHDKKPIEVRPAGPGSGWVVARQGDPDVISRHPTQLAAIKAGKPLARREATDFVVKGRDGHVRAPVELSRRPSARPPAETLGA